MTIMGTKPTPPETLSQESQAPDTLGELIDLVSKMTLDQDRVIKAHEEIMRRNPLAQLIRNVAS
ncbi:MAG: hypothetical protein Tsb0013_18280 [Phycisphaerales bacterium]